MILFLSSILIGFSALAEAPTPQSVLANRAGVSELKKTNPAAAQDKFIQGLAHTPFEAKLHMNLGLTFELLGQNEKARSSYETALKLAQDDQVRFAANFNLGELQQKERNKDEALKFYQQALKYNPESLETKVNIELLTQSNQGQGKGKSDDKNKDKKGDQDSKDKSDDKNEKGDDKNEDPKDQDKGKEKDQQDKKDQEKKYGKNKPQPQKFKSGDLNQGDVNKILGEIKQQEQKIRADFNKRDVKDKANDKDW